jgi:magnesium transporter
MADLNLLALPVVDEAGHLLGVVTHDDVIDIIQQEATEDMQRMVGAGSDESVHDRIFRSVRHRHVWLQFNLLTAFLAAAVVKFFEGAIAQLTLLAVFMPVIASLGSNAGSQTLAVAIRGLATGELELSESRKVIFRETIKGLINGLAIGLISGGIGFFMTDSWPAAIVIFVAVLGNMALACLVGAMIPLVLKRFRLDPAQSGTIFLTGITDVVGFVLLLSLGVVFLL